MHRPTKEEIATKLALHKRWLGDEEGGVRADFSGQDLRGNDLGEADLRLANLRLANLRGADLHGASLFDANLRGANLSEADLGEADLGEANLRMADLTRVNLRMADMIGADMIGANLGEANLGGADTGRARMPDGRTFEKWKTNPLEGICSEPEVRERAIGAWGNHAWKDCPMHSVHGVGMRNKVACFVALFDAKLLPRPT